MNSTNDEVEYKIKVLWDLCLTIILFTMEKHELKQIVLDAEVLANEEMREVKGGDTPPVCAVCCSKANGGISRE